MRLHLQSYGHAQVFLNYPFDSDFETLANAMHFGVVAAGLIPVCARDLTTPDRLRLEMLVDAITSCNYSAHDLSKCKGEGDSNYARFNMPIEMGMALFHAVQSQLRLHRCAFFVSNRDFQVAASDLAGLDPKNYNGDEKLLVASVYNWLRDVKAALNVEATSEILEKYQVFKRRLARMKGSGLNGRPTHDEAQELIFTMCAKWKWWEWRANKALLAEFPPLPLSWKDGR